MKRRDFIKYLGFVAMGSIVPFKFPEPKRMLLKISIAGKDMHFAEARTWRMGEIVRLYNVPVSVLGNND